MIELIELGLATWRVAHMAVREDGPLRVFRSLREASGIEYVTSDSDDVFTVHNDVTPLTCVLCTSVWVSLVMLAAPRPVRLWFAGSAIACLLEQYGSR